MLPDLAKEIAWWQGQMKPSDPAFGVGISDWTITSEYVDGLSTPEHGEVWGLTCSPSSLPERIWLTPGDIEAKQAHIMIRTPKSAAELAEIHETIPHELVHVLDARKAGSVADMENTAHSLGPLLAELRKNHPARAALLARAIAHPAMARAYRAGDGEMPEPADPDKDKEKKDPPKAAEGGASAAGDPDGEAMADILAKQDGPAALAWLAKFAGKAVDAALPGGEAAAPLPPEAPTLGMKQDDAYARARAEVLKESIDGLVDANMHLTDGQKTIVRKQPTVALAREVIASYPRATTEPEKPTLGLKGHPATGAGGGKPQSPLARAVAEAQGDPLFRKAMGLGAADNDGVQYDVPGHIVYIDGSERLRHQRQAYRNRRAAQ